MTAASLFLRIDNLHDARRSRSHGERCLTLPSFLDRSLRHLHLFAHDGPIGLVLAGMVAVKVALHVRGAARTEALAPVEPIRA
jgi:hypothetical protein